MIDETDARHVQGLQQALEYAHKRLSSVEARDFDADGFAQLKRCVSEYATDLVTESMQVARRNGSGTVSSRYVSTAAAGLVSRRWSNSRRFWYTLASFAFSAAASLWLSFLVASKDLTAGVSTGLAALGALGLAGMVWTVRD